MLDANLILSGPGIGRRFPASSPRTTFRKLAGNVRALRGWWLNGRHYRPERRYMRGSQVHAADSPKRH